MNDQIKEYLFGLVWAIVMIAVVFWGLGTDIIPESPDYFIQVVR